MLEVTVLTLPNIAVKLLMDALKVHQDNLSNEGCNDLFLKNTPEMYEFVRDAEAWASNGEMGDPIVNSKSIVTMDYIIVGYIANLLKIS